MDKYRIFCTEEQTRKALQLGAPIIQVPHGKYNPNGFYRKYHGEIGKSNYIDYQCPTAEEMIGWLEDQGITIESVRCDMFWFARSYSDENTNFNKGRFCSRKEAILAAIDAALDYLSDAK